MNLMHDQDLEQAKFDFLWPLAYPKESKDKNITKMMRQLVKDDVIQFGQMLEKAISVQCGLIRESGVGRDFTNGADAKLTSVRTCSRGRGYSAPVTSIKNKKGRLLIACYERKKKAWYFFSIPYHAYRDIPKSSNIDISFSLDGTPRRTPGRKTVKVNWWRYERKSIKDLL